MFKTKRQFFLHNVNSHWLRHDSRQRSPGNSFPRAGDNRMCCKQVKYVGPVPTFALEQRFSVIDTPFALQKVSYLRLGLCERYAVESYPSPCGRLHDIFQRILLYEAGCVTTIHTRPLHQRRGYNPLNTQVIVVQVLYYYPCVNKRPDHPF